MKNFKYFVAAGLMAGALALAGSAVFHGGTFPDVIHGGTFPDVAHGGTFPDVIHGGTFPDFA